MLDIVLVIITVVKTHQFPLSFVYSAESLNAGLCFLQLFSFFQQVQDPTKQYIKGSVCLYCAIIYTHKTGQMSNELCATVQLSTWKNDLL